MKFLYLKKQGLFCCSVATGFEPVTHYEIAFQVQRLNRSAKRPNSFYCAPPHFSHDRWEIRTPAVRYYPNLSRAP